MKVRRKMVREGCMWNLIFTRDNKKTIIKFYLVSENSKPYLYLPVILPQVSMECSSMKSCNIRRLLCKIGSFVVLLQVGCKILAVVLQVGWESLRVHAIPLPVFFLSSLIFFYSFPAQFTVVACIIFPDNVLYFLQKKPKRDIFWNARRSPTLRQNQAF